MLPDDFPKRLNECKENPLQSNGIGVALYLAGYEQLRKVDPSEAEDHLRKYFRPYRIPRAGRIALWYARGPEESILVRELAVITEIKGEPMKNVKRQGGVLNENILLIHRRENFDELEKGSLAQLVARYGDCEIDFYELNR